MGAEYRVNIVPESCLVHSIIEKTHSSAFECGKMSINLAILLTHSKHKA